MSKTLTLPVYFSGFSPVIELHANINDIGVFKISIKNPNNISIKNESVITYDWNDPEKIIIQNNNVISNLPVIFYEYKSAINSYVAVDDISSKLLSGGDMDLTIKQVQLPLDKDQNVFYKDLNSLDCTVVSGDNFPNQGDYTNDYAGYLICNPPKGNNSYDGYYEQGVTVKKSGVFDIIFNRKYMVGDFKIKLKYTALEV